ncbi:MAG: hypothetical protein PHO66_07340, partial [Eubacteriales bacterium]|nr:hypothetical protein [Eubacteriales bacterium]
FISITLREDVVLDVRGYDYLTHAQVSLPGRAQEQMLGVAVDGARQYTLTQHCDTDTCQLTLADEDGQQVIAFDTAQIFARFEGYTTEHLQLTQQEASFTTENDTVKMTVVVQNASMEGQTAPDAYFYADFYLLLSFR